MKTGKKPGKNRGRKGKRQIPGGIELTDSFIRGFVSTSLLAGLVDTDRRRLLRLGLQGGVAMSTAVAAARAATNGAPLQALLAVAIGGAGLALTEQLLGGTDPAATPDTTTANLMEL